jgi:hypothetical protein
MILLKTYQDKIIVYTVKDHDILSWTFQKDPLNLRRIQHSIMKEAR